MTEPADLRPPPQRRLPVLFTESAGGVVVHELVGHLLETDIVAAGGSVLARRLGTSLGSATLTLTDDPTLPDSWGGFGFDDEGMPARPTPLIRDGVLVGVLGSRFHPAPQAAAFVGANARRASFEHEPLPRMSNLVVSPGPETVNDLLAGVELGIWCDGLMRGKVDPAEGRFDLGMTSGRMIRNGRLAEHLTPALLSGDVISALAGLVGVGDDLDDMQTICGKSGQQVLVEMRSPSLLIEGIEVTA